MVTKVSAVKLSLVLLPDNKASVNKQLEQSAVGYHSHPLAQTLLLAVSWAAIKQFSARFTLLFMLAAQGVI
jgi:hypothetical protein